jgi:DNA-binding NarL/FixJ family response regulator
MHTRTAPDDLTTGASSFARSVNPGEKRVHKHTGRHASDAARSCTHREKQVVQLLRQALTNKQIAQQLGITEDTVKKHLLHIYNKLGVRRRTLVMLVGGRC